MRSYAKVSPKIWTGELGLALADMVEAGDFAPRIVADYLVSGPHANMIGLYRCGVGTMADDTGLAVEQVEAAVATLEELDFCTYDASTRRVLVHDMARHELIDGKRGVNLSNPEKARADNRIKSVAKILREHSVSDLVGVFAHTYPGIMAAIPAEMSVASAGLKRPDSVPVRRCHNGTQPRKPNEVEPSEAPPGGPSEARDHRPETRDQRPETIRTTTDLDDVDPTEAEKARARPQQGYPVEAAAMRAIGEKLERQILEHETPDVDAERSVALQTLEATAMGDRDREALETAILDAETVEEVLDAVDRIGECAVEGLRLVAEHEPSTLLAIVDDSLTIGSMKRMTADLKRPESLPAEGVAQ